MLLRQIFEAENKIASFAIGRLNPATIGHELLVNAIKASPGDPFLFLTDRAPKLPDNPLQPDEKLDWARKSFNGISIGLAKTVLTAADRLYKMGYTEVTFLEGEDKLYNLLKDYNNIEKPTHFYNFTKINYQQLKRDASATDATGMSGTKMREYVSKNDLNGFKSAVTTTAQPHAEEMFKKLQGIMGVDAVEENLDEYKFFKSTDNGSIKEQDPNKMKVLDWIADRVDGKEHFLSFYRKGAAWSGRLLFIKPEAANKFRQKVEDNPDHLDRIKKMLTSIETTSKLFTQLDISHDIRRAD